MKDLLINSIMRNITNYYDYNETKLKEIRYGLASLYLHLTKIIVIFSISYLLGNLKTLLILMGLYSILRLSAFGVHAKKSLHCWIASLIIFLLLPIICEKYIINKTIKIVTSIINTILLMIYAPADTEKRPLINKKRRKIYKIVSIMTGIIYTILIITTKNNVLNNCIYFGLCLGVIVILPITYKLFGVNYNNYKNYEKGGI